MPETHCLSHPLCLTTLMEHTCEDNCTPSHQNLAQKTAIKKKRLFSDFSLHFCSADFTVIFEIITFLIQKHFKAVTVTLIWGKLIQMTFKMVIGNQWKLRGDCGRHDGNGNGN